MACFTSTTNVLVSFSLPLQLVVGVVLNGLAGSCCRDADLHVFISFSSALCWFEQYLARFHLTHVFDCSRH